MRDLLSVLTLLALLWSILALLYQWYVAWGGGRRDYSAQSGRPMRGMLYNFTIAMLPSHKETVRLHPLKFLAGIVMHIGGFVAIASTHRSGTRIHCIDVPAVQALGRATAQASEHSG